MDYEENRPGRTWLHEIVHIFLGSCRPIDNMRTGNKTSHTPVRTRAYSDISDNKLPWKACDSLIPGDAHAAGKYMISVVYIYIYNIYIYTYYHILYNPMILSDIMCL